MLEHVVPHDAIAAHEAGHVIAALHMAVEPRGVRLVPRNTSPAGTDFDPEALDAVTGADRKLLAFAGLAGQIFAGTTWKGVHARSDVRWLLGDAHQDTSADASGRELLQLHQALFDHVRGQLEVALAAGTEYVTLEDLLRDAPR